VRLTQRGLEGALFRYQLMANIVGVLVIPLFVFFFLSLGFGGFKIELAIFGIGHGYLYIVYVITAGHLALKARLHIDNERGGISPRGVGWILLMFGAGLVPGFTFVVEWLVVTRKIHPLLEAQAAQAVPGVSPVVR
jgi:hypothetical protein